MVEQIKNQNLVHTNRSAEQVKEIRRRFLEEYEKNKDLFFLEDVQRVIESDWLVKRFYISKRKNVDEAVKMLITTMKWRLEWELPYMADWMYPIEFYKIGGLFPYEQDKEGNLVVYMRTCMHKKITELEEFEKKFLLRVFDKVEKITDGNGFAIVFDLTGAGYSNVDMEFLKFLLKCTTHFPVGLKYVLVYNLPWLLNALKNSVMVFVPEDLLGFLKFGSGDDLFKYIDRKNVPDFLNGTCKRNYRQIPKGSLSIEELVEDVGFTKETIDKFMPLFDNYLKEADEMLKKNNYIDIPDFFDEEPDEEDFRDFREMNKLKLSVKKGLITSEQYKAKLNEKLDNYRLKLLAKNNTKTNEKNVNKLDINSNITLKQNNLFNVIKVIPDKQLHFIYEPNENRYIVYVCIENNTNENVAFKVQSNYSDNFTVSPPNGIILPYKMINCTIKSLHLNIDFIKNCNFLILAQRVATNQLTYAEFSKLWNLDTNKIESVCLKTKFINPNLDIYLKDSGKYSKSTLENSDGNINKQMLSLSNKFDNQKKLQENYNFIIMIFLCLIIGILSYILFNKQLEDFFLNLNLNEKTFEKLKITNYVAGHEL